MLKKSPRLPITAYNRLKPKQEVPRWRTLTRAQRLDVINDGKAVDYLHEDDDFPGWRHDEFTKKYDNDQLADPLLSATAGLAHTHSGPAVSLV